MNILNLYAGIGGNRELWQGVRVTAVEHEPEIARAYADRFPDDTVIVGDAHSYLLENYKEFDFIWASPPCPTHSQYRYNVGVRAKGYAAVYPDMTLWQEIIFLMHHAPAWYVVENVRSYYRPLIPPVVIGRHYLWSNIKLPEIMPATANIRTKNKLSDFGVDISGYKIKNKRQVLRNRVDPRIGLAILDAAKTPQHIP